MANTDKALHPGTVLHSPHRDYTILRTLGAGGFGITYLVQGKIDNVACYFAVKEHFMASLCERSDTQAVFYSAPVSETVQSALKDFIAEAGRLNKQDVRHPNIVGINEVFEANNTAYYVMEYIPGKNLRQYVGEAQGGNLPERQALDIITPVLDALATMHRASITHLDMKPDNVLLATDPLSGQLRPVIIDFGLSKHYDAQGRPTSTINMAGCSEGYSPLEQYAGLSEFSPRADVYAVAATLYFMLSGRAPAKATEMTSERVFADLSHLVSPAVATAVAHAMTPDKKYRTPSIEAFAAELGISLPGGRQPRRSYSGEVPPTPPRPRPAAPVDRGATPVATPLSAEATPIAIPEVTPKAAPAVPSRPEKANVSGPRVAPNTPPRPAPAPRPVPPTPVPPAPAPVAAAPRPAAPAGGSATKLHSGPVANSGKTTIQNPVNGGVPPIVPPGGGGYGGPSPEPKKKRGTMIIAVIAVAIIMLILFFLFSILDGGDAPALYDTDTIATEQVVVEDTAAADTVEVKAEEIVKTAPSGEIKPVEPVPVKKSKHSYSDSAAYEAVAVVYDSAW